MPLWISRLFHRSSGVDRIDEPTGLQEPARVVAGRLSSGECGGHVDGEPARSHASPYEDTILDLLGSHLDDGSRSFDVTEELEVQAQPSTVDGEGLLGALYAHYCKALDTPQSQMPGAWVPSSLPPRVYLRGDAPHEDDWNRQSCGAVSSIFPDIERVDEAFGNLRAGAGAGDEEHEGVPEILRLFAPREYMTKGRIEVLHPPALTRREHHMLSIDSPLAELNGAARQAESETGNS